MNFNFEIDTTWCLDQLFKDGRITEKEKNLVQTTHRQRDQLKWHPLQWIAHFNLVDQSHPQSRLTLNRLCQWLAEKTQLPFYVIDPLKADVQALTSVMSQEFAFRNKILAVEVQANQVLIATDQPYMKDWIANLEQNVAPKKIQRVLLSPEQLQRYMVEYYQVSRAVSNSQKSGSYERDNKGVEALLQLGDSQNPDANDQHIVKLVDWVLQFAFEQGASDIHLEPRKDNGKVRFRIDGVLHTIYNMPANTLTAVISRIKILGRMNVAEKRKPQDGRLKTRTPKGQETELRLSTLPTAFGEKLVMRIFDPEVLVRSFQQLGFEGHLLSDWQALTSHSHGIILVTGPTGSGKTTTLYSSLKQLATEQVNTKNAMILSAIASGFVSSTATVASLGMEVRAGRALAKPNAGAALMSCIATLLQLLIIVAGVSILWLKTILIPTLVASVLLGICAYALVRSAPAQEQHQPTDSRMFSLKEAGIIALTLTLIQAVVYGLNLWLGDAGLIAGTLLASLFEIHAAMATVVMQGAPTDTATMSAFILGLAAHALAKSVNAALTGGKQYFIAFAPIQILHMVVLIGLLYWGFSL